MTGRFAREKNTRLSVMPGTGLGLKSKPIIGDLVSVPQQRFLLSVFPYNNRINIANLPSWFREGFEGGVCCNIAPETEYFKRLLYDPRALMEAFSKHRILRRCHTEPAYRTENMKNVLVKSS